MLTTTETPAKNLRVARCHGYYAWPGADPIGCPVCGGSLQTTTRLQRQQPWQVLDREEAREASRLPGGLPDLIAYERTYVDRDLARVGEALLDPEAHVELATGEEGTGSWYEAGDRILHEGDYGRLNLDAVLRGKAAKLAKIARLQRKLAKLGGEVAA